MLAIFDTELGRRATLPNEIEAKMWIFISTVRMGMASLAIVSNLDCSAYLDTKM